MARQAESVNWGMLMESTSRPGNNSFPADVFRRVADVAASGFPGIVSNRGDLSRRAAGRSSASSQCVCGTVGALHGAGEKPVGTLWRAVGGAGVGDQSRTCIVRRHRSCRWPRWASPAGLDAHEFWRDHDRIRHRSGQTGGVRLQWTEPNEKRWSIQLGALDSWSARASVAPSANWTAQYSVGRLEHPEAAEPGSQWRQTASVEYNRPVAAGNWATFIDSGGESTKSQPARR